MSGPGTLNMNKRMERKEVNRGKESGRKGRERKGGSDRRRE